MGKLLNFLVGFLSQKYRISQSECISHDQTSTIYRIRCKQSEDSYLIKIVRTTGKKLQYMLQIYNELNYVFKNLSGVHSNIKQTETLFFYKIENQKDGQVTEKKLQKSQVNVNVKLLRIEMKELSFFHHITKSKQQVYYKKQQLPLFSKNIISLFRQLYSPYIIPTLDSLYYNPFSAKINYWRFQMVLFLRGYNEGTTSDCLQQIMPVLRPSLFRIPQKRKNSDGKKNKKDEQEEQQELQQVDSIWSTEQLQKIDAFLSEQIKVRLFLLALFCFITKRFPNISGQSLEYNLAYVRWTREQMYDKILSEIGKSWQKTLSLNENKIVISAFEILYGKQDNYFMNLFKEAFCQQKAVSWNWLLKEKEFLNNLAVKKYVSKKKKKILQRQKNQTIANQLGKDDKLREKLLKKLKPAFMRLTLVILSDEHHSQVKSNKFANFQTFIPIKLGIPLSQIFQFKEWYEIFLPKTQSTKLSNYMIYTSARRLYQYISKQFNTAEQILENKYIKSHHINLIIYVLLAKMSQLIGNGEIDKIRWQIQLEIQNKNKKLDRYYKVNHTMQRLKNMFEFAIDKGKFQKQSSQLRTRKLIEGKSQRNEANGYQKEAALSDKKNKLSYPKSANKDNEQGKTLRSTGNGQLQSKISQQYAPPSVVSQKQNIEVQNVEVKIIDGKEKLNVDINNRLAKMKKDRRKVTQLRFELNAREIIERSWQQLSSFRIPYSDLSEQYLDSCFKPYQDDRLNNIALIGYKCYQLYFKSNLKQPFQYLKKIQEQHSLENLRISQHFSSSLSNHGICHSIPNQSSDNFQDIKQKELKKIPVKGSLQDSGRKKILS